MGLRVHPVKDAINGIGGDVARHVLKLRRTCNLLNSRSGVLQ